MLNPCPVGQNRALQFGQQFGLRLILPLKQNLIGMDHRLILRFTQIEAVLVDELLHCRVNQVGDVAVEVDVFTDTGRTDVLQMGRQGQLDHLAGDERERRAVMLSLVALLAADPPEHDMVHRMDRIRRRSRTIGGGVAHHVAADHNIKLLAGEHPAQAAQVSGVGDVDRHIIREQLDMQLVGNRHADNLPPDQVGLGLFGPGKLVYREVDLEPEVADRPHDPLM